MGWGLPPTWLTRRSVLDCLLADSPGRVSQDRSMARIIVVRAKASKEKRWPWGSGLSESGLWIIKTRRALGPGIRRGRGCRAGVSSWLGDILLSGLLYRSVQDPAQLVRMAGSTTPKWTPQNPSWNGNTRRYGGRLMAPGRNKGPQRRGGRVHKTKIVQGNFNTMQVESPKRASPVACARLPYVYTHPSVKGPIQIGPAGLACRPVPGSHVISLAEAHAGAPLADDGDGDRSGVVGSYSRGTSRGTYRTKPQA
ncbi:hypothetical protein MAPG_00574 [Magnaporthiopsis poae ATCC 64411]|uniref:Uncharacterized protein n=1 Tax=Magnaporthiopsis poae (strain ATCC 64411 / 73-15) TaxID=644358 RepID=A0A0C4DLD3_MAGP6|nr:hypothetical protein MAPG_00574 [Magnaporthiopsis poae ATCC 64411]